MHASVLKFAARSRCILILAGIVAWGMFIGSGCTESNEPLQYETLRSVQLQDGYRAQQCNQRGLNHIQHNELEQAAQAFREALEADLYYPSAHNNLGLTLLEQGRYYEAAWEFQFAATLAPQNPEPRHNLGLVYESVGRLHDAGEAYEQALAIDPDRIETMGHYVRLQIKQDRTDPETVTLLRDLALRSSDEEWQVWARKQLTRLGRKED